MCYKYLFLQYHLFILYQHCGCQSPITTGRPVFTRPDWLTQTTTTVLIYNYMDESEAVCLWTVGGKSNTWSKLHAGTRRTKAQLANMMWFKFCNKTTFGMKLWSGFKKRKKKKEIKMRKSTLITRVWQDMKFDPLHEIHQTCFPIRNQCFLHWRLNAGVGRPVMWCRIFQHDRNSRWRTSGWSPFKRSSCWGAVTVREQVQTP